MAITCSLLGHDFGETEVERDREERGSEVVTSVREVTVCRRCGAERVLSENTEVTTVVAPEETPADVAAESEAAAAPGDAPDDDSGAFDAPDDDEFEDYDPDDDDAVILSDDPDQRDYGDWPSEPGQTYRPWDPDTLVHEDEDDDGPTVAEMMGEPVDGTHDDDDADAVGAADTAAEAGDGAEVIEAGGEAVEPAAEPTSTPGADYHCPACGLSVAAQDSSYRPGDACPSCREGYLTVSERNP